MPGIATRIPGQIPSILVPFSLTRWCEGGRGRRLAEPGHRCPQTSAGGTRQSLAWLAGPGKFSRHSTHLLEKNGSKAVAEPLQPPLERPTTWEPSWFILELLPSSTRGHSMLRKEGQELKEWEVLGEAGV